VSQVLVGDFIFLVATGCSIFYLPTEQLDHCNKVQA